MTYLTVWIDVETTGLFPSRQDIITMGYLFEMEGEILLERDLQLRPIKPENIEAKALAINGMSEEEIMKFPPADEAYSLLVTDLRGYVDKYNKFDKAIFAGFNARFDSDFVRALFRKMGDKYFGSWFFPSPLDVMGTLVERMREERIDLVNHKLVTVCSHFGIDLKDAHTALADIRATRELYYKIKEK